MKKFSLVVVSFLLAACSGGAVGVSCQEQYWDGTVGMCLTEGWKVVDRETLQSRGVPDDVVVAFQKEVSVAGQFPTITVTKENVAPGVDSPAFSQASVRSVTGLPGYKLIDTRPAKIDGQEVQLHIFSAQPVTEEPERRFYQVSAVANKTGYTWTGITPLAVNDATQKEMTVMMNSISLTDPAKSEEEASE